MDTVDRSRINQTDLSRVVEMFETHNLKTLPDIDKLYSTLTETVMRNEEMQYFMDSVMNTAYRKEMVIATTLTAGVTFGFLFAERLIQNEQMEKML